MKWDETCPWKQREQGHLQDNLAVLGQRIAARRLSLRAWLVEGLNMMGKKHTIHRQDKHGHLASCLQRGFENQVTSLDDGSSTGTWNAWQVQQSPQVNPPSSSQSISCSCLLSFPSSLQRSLTGSLRWPQSEGWAWMWPCWRACWPASSDVWHDHWGAASCHHSKGGESSQPETM